jgi:hypothetical protein
MAGTAIGAPTECDIEKRRGDTKDIQVRLTSDAVAINVQGYTARLTISTVKKPVDTSTQIFQTTASINSPASDGILRFDFALFDSQSPEIVPGNYHYDVEVTDGAGEIFTPLVGKFKVVQDISK